MTTFGDELRRERELRGVELRDVAEATKVNLRFLEALERNEFDELPGGLFTRGFIRAYATHIGADPDKLVNAYLFQISNADAPAGTYRPSAPEDAAEHGAEPGRTGRRPARGWVWVAGLAALISLPVAFLLLRPSAWNPPSAAGEPRAEPAPLVAPAARRLEIRAEASAQVRARCDDVVRIDRTLSAGERAGFRCAGRIRVDASDGGAIRLSVDDVPLGRPGPAGEAVEGWEPPAS